MEIQYDKIEIFRDNISTLKKTSLSEENEIKNYMTESTVSVINFDKVKKAYIRKLQPKPEFMPSSSDALHIGDNGKISFIEFKNGKINGEQRYGIYQKIYDSLLIFNDITGESVSSCREDADFILVYNESKNSGVKEGGIKEIEGEQHIQE